MKRSGGPSTWLAFVVLGMPCASAAVATSPRIEVWTDARSDVVALKREALRARTAGDAGRESDAAGRLALAQMDLGEFDDAMLSAAAALAAANAAGDAERVLIARGIVGDAHFYLGDFESALADFQSVHDAYRGAGRRIEAAKQLKNVGIALHVLGRWEEAADALEAAAATLRAAGDLAEASSAQENLGRAYLLLGDTTRGLHALKEAVELAEQLRQARPLAHALLRYATVYVDTEFYDKALPPLEEAYAIFTRLDAPLEAGWTLSLIAESLSHVGRLDEAIAVEQRALAIDRAMIGAIGPENLAKLGILYLDRDPRQALLLLERSRQRLERGSYPVEWWIHAAIGKARGKLGELDLAIDSYDNAIDSLESARSRIVSERYRAMYLRKHQSVYRELLELLWDRHVGNPAGQDAELAFAVAESAKGRSLVDAIRETRENFGTPAGRGGTRNDDGIRAEIASLERRLQEPGSTPVEREELLEQVDRKEAELALAVADLRRRDPRYAALMYPQPVVAAEARALIDARTALLAYVEAEHHLLAFVVTRDALRVVRLDTPPSVVSARVQNYVELMTDEDPVPAQAVARRLYADLVAPLRPFLPDGISDLIVAPDGALNFLPFETLLEDDRYLLESYNIAYVPSATVLRELRRETTEGSPAGQADLLMFANPAAPGIAADGNAASTGAHTRALYENEGLSFPEIPYSGVEARFLKRIVDRRSRVFLGEDATERRVKTTPLEPFRVIHFATHGFVSQRWPARSALLLAAGTDGMEDGLLTVPEICRLRLASDLVVLSACRTARGQILAGDGVQGLARAFLHAGSRAVLASLWDVDDDRTAVLMRRFYEALESGRTQSEALREAKLSMIRDTATSPPRYWAGFILSGDATQPIRLEGRAWWQRSAVWSIAALGAIAIYLALRSSRATG